MYRAFDSALRASDYNMFQAPLKKVDAPTAFRAVQMSTDAPRVAFIDAVVEDPEEITRRVAAEYAEFDRLVAGSAIKSDGKARLLKGKGAMLGGATRVKGKSAPIEKEDDASVQAAQEASELAGEGVARRGRTKVRGLEALGDFASEFFSADGKAETEPVATMVGKVGGKVNREEILEGYDELQALLGMKPKAGARTRMDSAVLKPVKGNQTETTYKSVTLKDPLSRVYAQRLKDLPADIGSKEAVMRAPSPNGKGRTPSPDAKSSSFVDDLLSEVRGRGENVETVPRSIGRSPSRQGKEGGGGRAKGGRGSDAEGAKEPKKGGNGRVVMNHSTHIDGLIPVLKRLCQTQVGSHLIWRKANTLMSP